MANDEIDEPEEGFEEFEDDFDDDADLDADLDDDVDISDSDEETSTKEEPLDIGFDERTYEQALRANPKRLAAVQKRAGVIETILDRSELNNADGVRKAWETLNKEIDTTISKAYTIDATFEANQVVNHPLFGIGFVNQILSPTKVEVIFESGIKRLVCNR